MQKENIIVFGGSDHARLVIDIIKKEDKYNIIGIVDDFIIKNKAIKGIKVLGKIKNLESILRLHKEVNKGIIAIGDNYTRYLIANKIEKYRKNFSFITTIHPSAIIGSDVKIDQGTIIAAGVLINNDTHIGEHCYLAFKSAISHDSVLNDFSSLGPGVTTGGNVKIGSCTAVGLGANILNEITIGNHSMIGSGCLVVKNVADQKVVYGVPAKMIREREIGEKYL